LTLHRENPKKIICRRAHGIKFDKNNNLLPYMEWDWNIEPGAYFKNRLHSPESVFPVGIGGVLYPPQSLHKDAVNLDLIAKLSPRSDDVWFWAMAVINKEYFGEESPYLVVPGAYNGNFEISVDPKYDKNSKSNFGYNNFEGGKDKQIKNVIEYYPQIKTYLNKI
jgi:hypothetical protein